jgi:hypothetical protein
MSMFDQLVIRSGALQDDVAIVLCEVGILTPSCRFESEIDR